MLAAFTVANYSSPTITFKYPILPWLAITILGWVFGRHLTASPSARAGFRKEGAMHLRTLGLLVFAVVRGIDGYGNLFLHRADNSWQQWLHISKYPPSLAYYSLKLGILFLCVALLRRSRCVLVSGRTAFSTCLDRLRCSTTSYIASHSRRQQPISVCGALTAWLPLSVWPPGCSCWCTRCAAGIAR